MKVKSIITILLLTSALFTKAQIMEINPAVGWNYVKSQELELADDVWYNTDFPAEIGYDYIFVMNHKLDTAKASLQIFDMQDTYIAAKNKDTSSGFMNLAFEVKESGMYKVFFLVNDKIGPVTSHNVQLMLIRRKKL